MNCPSVCDPPETNDFILYDYEEYYIGERDEASRRNGQGENHWSGPYALEWYKGSFKRDTLHGEGEYRWRHRGFPSSHRDVTYEGHVFANQLHGYGVMSYPNGVTFVGLYHSDIRWGPGVETGANTKENVGLWRGTQLVRLSWRPAGHSIIPDLQSLLDGRRYIETFRSLLQHSVKTIGKTNSAIDLLKQLGADPVFASKNWQKLYPTHCTDLNSKLCNKDVFTHDYYKGKIRQLSEINFVPLLRDGSQISGESSDSREIYYAWNNNKMSVHMMKHCYTHDKQRMRVPLNLPSVLHGPRTKFHAPGEHESHCRCMLMSSYLGNVIPVTRFVNELHVYPDIADIQGNTALMYAVCGDKTDIIHFLVEAGANANSYNDACLTPLGIALIRFLCIQKDIRASQIVQSILPPTTALQYYQTAYQNDQHSVSDWLISRDLPPEITSISNTGTLVKQKVPPKPELGKKEKSFQIVKEMAIISRIKSEFSNAKLDDIDDDDQLDMSLPCIEQQYSVMVNDLFSLPATIPIQYLFAVQDMIPEVLNAVEFESRKVVDKTAKKPVGKDPSKLRNVLKQSKDAFYQNLDEKEDSLTSVEKEKLESLQKIRSTISQLLADGAKVNLVQCPQPALVLATISGSPELVGQLIHHGADVNEKFHQIYNYSALDIAVTGPLTPDNFELIKTLLENGAKTNDRLDYYVIENYVSVYVPGPTLLHAILAKSTNNEFEEEILNNLLALFLQYKCDPTVLFQGRSAVDIAMSRKIELLDIIIKSPTTNLNAIINDSNQTILVKMFSPIFFRTLEIFERLQIFTNLMIYGADPLMACQEENNQFANIFVYAQQCFGTAQKDIIATSSKQHLPKSKPKDEKSMKSKLVMKLGKGDENLQADFKQSVDLVADCARILITRRLQARLMNDLVEIIDKYKHREWNMILKEHKNKKRTALWLETERCLEIWDIMKKAKRRQYKDEKVLKYLICFVLFYNKRLEMKDFKSSIITREKNEVDKEAWLILRENKTFIYSEDFLERHYVKPEINKDDDTKLNVCFECIMPLTETSIRCFSCKMVSFCNMACIEANVNRIGEHPCSQVLKEKYFPELDEDNSLSTQ